MAERKKTHKEIMPKNKAVITDTITAEEINRRVKTPPPLNRREAINRIAYYGTMASALVLGIFGLYIRFANPDMTETRLLITYWWKFLITAIPMIVFGIIFRSTEK